MTTLLIDFGYLAVALVAAMIARMLRRAPDWRAVVVTIALMLVVTAIGDNVLTAVGMVVRGPAELSGIRVGLAPIEDFAVPLALGLLLPSVIGLMSPPRTPPPSS